MIRTARLTDEEVSRRIRASVYTWASLGQTRRVSRLLAEVRARGFRLCPECRLWRQGGCGCRVAAPERMEE